MLPEETSKPTLGQLYAEHDGKVSDKWSLYLSVYERLFSHLRDAPIRILEIGIQNGGSLEIWSRFFPNAELIVGCDIDPLCENLRYEDDRISVVVGDAGEPHTKEKIRNISDHFDIIIEDGSHRSDDIVKAFAAYFDLVSPGGVFVAEDLHCSYWSDWLGGLNAPFSSMSFFKRLADIVNRRHWGGSEVERGFLEYFENRYALRLDDGMLETIQCVAFFDSLSVVEKARENVPSRLGARIVVGREDLVYPREKLHDSVEPRQDGNPWGPLCLPIEHMCEQSFVLREERDAILAEKERLDREKELGEAKNQSLEKGGRYTVDENISLKKRIAALTHEVGASSERNQELERKLIKARTQPMLNLRNALRFRAASLALSAFEALSKAPPEKLKDVAERSDPNRKDY